MASDSDTLAAPAGLMALAVKLRFEASVASQHGQFDALNALAAQAAALAENLASWRPPARVITSAAELDALPFGSIVLPKHCSPFMWSTLPVGFRWVSDGFPDGLTSHQLLAHYAALGGAVTVLHTPTKTGDTE